jgi:spore maturation protein CgeB
MRIFVPASAYEDSFAENVAATLTSMGHEVRSLGSVSHAEYWSVPRYAWRTGIRLLARDRPGLLDRKIVRVAREFKPDAVIATTGEWHSETLAALGRLCPGRMTLWWGDAPANSRRWTLVDPSWDFIYVKDRVAVSKLRLVGRNAFLLHEAMNPSWHRRVARQANERIATVGNWYAFRQALVLRLLSSGVSVDLHGSCPPRWAHPEIRRRHSGRFLVREEKSRVFGEALACLNSFALAEGDSLNCRAFEIAGAGGLQLIEHRQAIGECFEPGRELLAFSDFEELLDHIARARREPAAMEIVRAAGSRRALAQHTYRHRLEDILRRWADA